MVALSPVCGRVDSVFISVRLVTSLSDCGAAVHGYIVGALLARFR